MSTRGTSTHGYGKSLLLVVKAYCDGLTMPEAAKACGLSYGAVYGVKKRMNLDFKLNKGRRKHGSVKEIVLLEHQNGLTPREIINKHNLVRCSVYSVLKECSIKPNKK
jgi:transposase